MWVSQSLEPILNFSAFFWLEEGLVLSCQKYCTGPFTTSMNFISEHGNLPMKSHTHVWPESSCYLLTQYLQSVLTSKLTSLDVGLGRQKALVLLFTIDRDNTGRATLGSFERDLFPIVLNPCTKLLTIWELGSKVFIIFILKFLLITVTHLDFNNNKTNLHLSPSHLESK